MVQSTGPTLSVVFVDYDNIYLSLKRKNEEAARRFAKDAGGWLRGIETGRLITSTQGMSLDGPRRIVLNRCYGNPSPRRNPTDNSTDMNSFPFVRHHFLRSGFEVVDCPPLTAQLKNSADIKMVMDVLDFLKHQTYFDEFVLLSGDADFTPVLHRLRAHARRTVVYANDHTATPYTAISDGEVRENDLITMLMEGRVTNGAEAPALIEKDGPSPAQLDQIASKIIDEVAATVQSAGQPVPLEALADRAVRILGHDRTVGTNWAGAGTFRDLLVRRLPGELRMSEQAPYYIFDARRQLAAEPAVREPRRIEAREPVRAPLPDLRHEPRPEPRPELRPELRAEPRLEPQRPVARPAAAPSAGAYAPAAGGYGATMPGYGSTVGAPLQPQQRQAAPAQQRAAPAPAAPQAVAPAQADRDSPAKFLERIYGASQAPPLAPSEYVALFEAMAEEITVNSLAGAQTVNNIAQRVLQLGAEVHPDDIRFVMEVVSEPDPWFEQGASPILLANRFRNYVIAQCRRHQMQLSATEIDLIEMWITGNPQQGPAKAAAAPAMDPTDAYRRRAPAPTQEPAHHSQHPVPGARQVPPKQTDPRADRWWHLDSGPTGPAAESRDADDFPRIMRPRGRG